MEDKYYKNIKQCLIDNEIYKKVKDYSKNKNDLITYYNVGKELYEAGKHYGEGIIKKYSKKLNNDLNIKYDISSLNKMKKFYLLIEKMATVSPNLSYSHYVELLSLNNINEIKYYIDITKKQSLSIRELRKKIKSKEYERLPLETRNKLIIEEKIEINHLVPDPILIKNKNNIEIISERVLHNLIMEDIESFLKELGNGFCFIGSEYKIKIGDYYHKIDLLLF